MISTMTELLELIYNKLHEILIAIKKQGDGGDDEPKPKPISQEKFNTAMDKAVEEVNKLGRGK